MTDEQTAPNVPVSGSEQLSVFKPLRVWPPVVLLGLMLIARYLPKLIQDGPPQLWMVSAFGPLLCGALILLWWLLLSRATGWERLGGVIGLAIAVSLALATIHSTMMGPALMVRTIPMGMAGFALGAILLAQQLSFRRTVLAMVLATMGFGYSTLLRSDGMWGDFVLGLHWRWEPSAEDQMLTDRALNPDVVPNSLNSSDIEAWLAEPEVPAFRGADRSGRYLGPLVFADWAADEPEELWRIAVGPGWSSFSVAGNLLFTQEQRGEHEAVVCLTADTGKEVWSHEIESRFDDPLGGPGPRATPTLADGAIYALGGNGELMRLDAATGDSVWQIDLRDVAEREPPMWGFCSSPLVVGDAVIVHAGGKGNKGTLAFEANTGDLKWSAAAGEHSYSSPQLCRLGGDEFVAMLSDAGLNLLDPRTGEDQLSYQWKHQGYRALQPQLVNGDSILLPTGVGTGTRCVRVLDIDIGLQAEEIWTTRDLKPDFNDMVVFQDHIYGFDGAVFTCVDLATGKRVWKGGRYGKGQVLLLEASGLLLVAAETGKLVLLKADPAGHQELATRQVLNGKTWNHPVVVGDRLFLRNSEQAVCLRLPVKKAD